MLGNIGDLQFIRTGVLINVTLGFKCGQLSVQAVNLKGLLLDAKQAFLDILFNLLDVVLFFFKLAD